MKKSYTVAELAERWGVHRATIYRLIRRGELATFKVGATRRITFDAVAAIEAEKKESPGVAPCRPV